MDGMKGRLMEKSFEVSPTFARWYGSMVRSAYQCDYGKVVEYAYALADYVCTRGLPGEKMATALTVMDEAAREVAEIFAERCGCRG